MVQNGKLTNAPADIPLGRGDGAKADPPIDARSWALGPAAEAPGEPLRSLPGPPPAVRETKEPRTREPRSHGGRA